PVGTAGAHPRRRGANLHPAPRAARHVGIVFPRLNRERESSSRGGGGRGSRQRRQVAQYGVLAVTLAAPIAIGGGRPWVQVGLAAATVVCGLAWRLSRRRDMRLPPF